MRAFRLPFLSYLVGLTVTASGLTSMATSSNAFAEALQRFLGGIPLWLIVAAFIAGITFLNFWGIRESMWANLLCTAIEVGGLVFIIAVGARYWGSVDYTLTPQGKSVIDPSSWSLMLTGAVLTFYSFVGFEDMLNVAEEVNRKNKGQPHWLPLCNRKGLSGGLLRFGGLRCVLLAELLDATRRVDDLLLARIERVARGAHLDVEGLAQRRARGPRVAAAAGDRYLSVLRVDFGFHGTDSRCGRSTLRHWKAEHYQPFRRPGQARPRHA